MNKIKQLLIGIGLLTLSANAAAMLVNVDGTDYTSFKDLKPVIQDILDKNLVTDISEKRYNKLSKKFDRYNQRTEKRIERREAGKNTKRVKRKIKKIKRSIKKKLRKWNLVALTNSNTGTGGSDTDSDYDNGTSTGGGDHSSIPEPSTIALLGLGLIGAGVARKLKKNIG